MTLSYFILSCCLYSLIPITALLYFSVIFSCLTKNPDILFFFGFVSSPSFNFISPAFARSRQSDSAALTRFLFSLLYSLSYKKYFFPHTLSQALSGEPWACCAGLLPESSPKAPLSPAVVNIGSLWLCLSVPNGGAKGFISELCSMRGGTTTFPLNFATCGEPFDLLWHIIFPMAGVFAVSSVTVPGTEASFAVDAALMVECCAH